MLASTSLAQAPQTMNRHGIGLLDLRQIDHREQALVLPLRAHPELRLDRCSFTCGDTHARDSNSSISLATSSSRTVMRQTCGRPPTAHGATVDTAAAGLLPREEHP